MTYNLSLALTPFQKFAGSVEQLCPSTLALPQSSHRRPAVGEMCCCATVTDLVFVLISIEDMFAGFFVEVRYEE
jgi:hypothetical protein